MISPPHPQIRLLPLYWNSLVCICYPHFPKYCSQLLEIHIRPLVCTSKKSEINTLTPNVFLLYTCSQWHYILGVYSETPFVETPHQIKRGPLWALPGQAPLLHSPRMGLPSLLLGRLLQPPNVWGVRLCLGCGMPVLFQRGDHAADLRETLQSSPEDKDLACPHTLSSLWGQSSLGTKSLVNIPILLTHLCPMLLPAHLTWFREPFLFFRPMGVPFDGPDTVTNPLYTQSQNAVVTLHRRSVHRLACTQSSRLWLPWGQGQLIDSTFLAPSSDQSNK